MTAGRQGGEMSKLDPKALQAALYAWVKVKRGSWIDALTAAITAYLDALPSPAAEPVAWRCFHCDEVFHDRSSARDHFGRDESAEPGCLIKLGAERSMLKAVRQAEADAAEAWAAVQNECTDAAKAYHRQSGRHHQQLTAAEELGYERGLRDAAPVELDALRRERDAARAEVAELRSLNDWQDTTVYNEERSQLYGKVAWLEHESTALHEVLHAVAAALSVTLRDTPSVNGLLFIEDAQRLPATLTRVTEEKDEAVRLLERVPKALALASAGRCLLNDINAFFARLSRKDQAHG